VSDHRTRMRSLSMLTAMLAIGGMGGMTDPDEPVTFIDHDAPPTPQPQTGAPGSNEQRQERRRVKPPKAARNRKRRGWR
jgi:hypothetical protein